MLAVASKIGLLRIDAQFMRLPEKRKAALSKISSSNAKAFLHSWINRHRMQKRIASNLLQCCITV